MFACSVSSVKVQDVVISEMVQYKDLTETLLLVCCSMRHRTPAERDVVFATHQEDIVMLHPYHSSPKRKAPSKQIYAYDPAQWEPTLFSLIWFTQDLRLALIMIIDNIKVRQRDTSAKTKCSFPPYLKYIYLVKMCLVIDVYLVLHQSHFDNK